MGFIDVDSHALEVPATWDYLDPKEEHFRPQVLTFEAGSVIRLGARANNTALPRTPSQLWTAGDTWARYTPAHGAMSPHVNMYDAGMLDLTDPAARVEALDALGIDVQVIFSTFFIGAELDNPLEEAALTRSYNRWVGESLSGYTDRLKWVVRPPLRLMDRALQELEYAANHGAAGIHLRGIEHGYYLCDPYFFPLYEKAQDLNLAIVVHNGATIRKGPATPIGNFTPHPPALMGQLVNLMYAFHAVLSSDIPERFPRLRWGFIEGGATFTLPVMHQHARRDMSIGVTPFLDAKPVHPEDIERMNVFVAVETDEDVPYLANALGEQSLIVGTDFGHNDLGTELGAHQTILERQDVRDSLAQKIVNDNGRALYDIDPKFQPAPAEPAFEDIPHVHAAAGGPAIVVPTWVRDKKRIQRSATV
ncbi:amidohydrolase family protein [Dactylosporangium sp. NPDC051484]|uniref:amidohydrolase family protein n=1 Tax=Dactylosporangium sp. NPDC051484 TaxID=3154942 RepID=UPI00344F9FD0